MLAKASSALRFPILPARIHRFWWSPVGMRHEFAAHTVRGLKIANRFHCWAARDKLRTQDCCDHGCNRGCSYKNQVGPGNRENLWWGIKNPGEDGHEHLRDSEAQDNADGTSNHLNQYALAPQKCTELAALCA